MCTLLVGCNDSLTEGIFDVMGNRTIKIGGVVSDDVITVQTRAGETTDTVRAETVEWMKGALRHGLDITYSNLDGDGRHVTRNQHVAILKWTGETHPTSRRGNYTFKYKIGGGDAEWYDNGPHYFEGEYVPAKIRTTEVNIDAVNLTTNQADDSDYTYIIDGEGNETTEGTIGNYTLLSHYVGMPPNWTTSATVDQVLLPFKHRLARVIAYILIDPDLKDKTGLNPAKLKGYEKDANGKDNPSTTELRFANVKVLEKVQEVAADASSDAAASLTPQWTKARRVIPHFESELTTSVNNKHELAVPTTATQTEIDAANSGFIVYIRKRDEKPIHPREDDWYDAHKDYLQKGPNSAYTQKKYLSVPVYDIIVRPTLKTTDDVMYDEAGYYNNDKTVNESTLTTLVQEENSIEFEMTLNNDLVYTKKFDFDLNANQQTIVYITIDRESIDYDESTSETWVSTNTQDNYFGVNNDLGHNMSMAGSSWQRAFRNSTSSLNVTDGNGYGDKENGEDVGQYVTGETWIKAFAQAYQGGAHHGDYFILDKDITIDATLLPKDFVFTGHLDGRGHTITLSNVGQNVYKVATDINHTLYTKSGNNYNEYAKPEHLYEKIIGTYTYDEYKALEGNENVTEEQFDALSDEQKRKETILVVQITLDILLNRQGLYTDKQCTIPFNNPPALYEFSHNTGSSLFAGLNATYTTEQEKAQDPFAKNADGTPVVTWEANVHKEGNYWVPVKGYRAELYNVKLPAGISFFPVGTTPDGSLSNAVVNGYIYNCWEGSTPISNKVPIPAY